MEGASASAGASATDIQVIMTQLQNSYAEMQQSREATVTATRAAHSAAAAANAAREENAENGDRIRQVQTEMTGIAGLIQQVLDVRGGGVPPGGPPGGSG